MVTEKLPHGSAASAAFHFQRIPELDGFRFAVLVVVIGHDLEFRSGVPFGILTRMEPLGAAVMLMLALISLVFFWFSGNGSLVWLRCIGGWYSGVRSDTGNFLAAGSRFPGNGGRSFLADGCGACCRDRVFLHLKMALRGKVPNIEAARGQTGLMTGQLFAPTGGRMTSRTKAGWAACVVSAANCAESATWGRRYKIPIKIQK